MPTVTLVAPSAPLSAECVVIGVLSTSAGPALAAGAQPVDTALGNQLLAAVQACGGTGNTDEVLTIPTLGLAGFPLVLATGLGDGTPEQIRRGVGAALRACSARRRVHIAVDGPLDAVAEGALMGSYTFGGYRSGRASPALRAVTIAAHADAGARAALRRTRIVADAVALARDLVNTPPNELYPETFAGRVADLAAAGGLDVEVLDPRALARGGFGGILGVGGGSARPPRLVRLSYLPARPRARIALVGKGVTFDSGGLNLKTSQLTWMKSDMGGAAAVIAATLAAAALKLPVEITATLPMAENMPSGSSLRPSDVLTLRDGTTVEVTNTDAEGRLILADAITRAVEDGPDYLLEVSTLSGGQLIALGPRVIGAMGEPALRDRVVALGNDTGESLWAMPLPAELRSALDSNVADIANLPSERWASMLVAGRFLAEFVPEGLAWVHLDIAGPAWNSTAARDYTPKGATGAAVRTLIASLVDLSAR